MRSKTIFLAVLASLPLGLVAVRAAALDVPRFWDPCFHWADGSGTNRSGSYAYSLRPGDPCASGLAGTSETKRGAVIRLLIVPGGIMAAIAFAILGATRSRSRLAILGACLMFLEAFPLVFSFAPVAVLTGGAYLLVAKRARSTPLVPL